MEGGTLIRILAGVAIGGGIFWLLGGLLSPEERAARSAERAIAQAEAAAQVEAERLSRKAAYVSHNLPEGCTIDHLPKYGPVDHIILVRCTGQTVTSSNYVWKEERSTMCGKVPCTVHDDKQGVAITIEP